MTKEKKDILIVGVGGQGVLLASEIISETALRHGHDVKKSEVHGMSQRGGVVSSHVRFGERVFSPTIPYGKADVLLAFEQSEALRAAERLDPDGIAIVASTHIIPAIVTSSKKYDYPYDALDRLRQIRRHLIDVDAEGVALELGNLRLANTILLGVLSRHLTFEVDLWQEVIRDKIKEKFVELNLTAFERGRRLTGSGVAV